MTLFRRTVDRTASSPARQEKRQDKRQAGRQSGRHADRRRGMMKTLAVAAFGALGFFAMGAAPAAAKSSVKCVAAAETRLGKELRGTREAAVRPRAKRACKIALNECAFRLDKLRDRTGRALPFATCRVQFRERVANFHKVRCAAQAFTRRGFEVSGTRAVEVRRKRKVACNVALDRCERRLDRKQFKTGKFRHARCEVTGTKRVAFDHKPLRPTIKPGVTVAAGLHW